MTTEEPKRPPGRPSSRPANYGDATPEDVGKALVNYRPERKQDGGERTSALTA